ncbi:hypothetical protein BGZ99_004896, partial [Dissophora globulifera]
MNGTFAKWRKGYDAPLRKRNQFKKDLVEAVLDEVKRHNHVLLQERVEVALDSVAAAIKAAGNSNNRFLLQRKRDT